MRALISVSDKTGVVEFARELVSLGWELLSTSGTMKMLKEAGLPVTSVSDVTGFPEICDGRVKTLHPKIHGALLARRDLPDHMHQLEENGIGTIDLVCVNLYPFRETIAKPDVTMEDAIEHIDIGGPSMVSTSESLYFQTRVIGEAVASKMLEDIFSLLKRVLFKGEAGLGNVLRQTVVCGGEKFESFPEDFGSLTEFPAVAGSENDFCDFHECKYPKNKGKIHRNG